MNAEDKLNELRKIMINKPSVGDIDYKVIPELIKLLTQVYAMGFRDGQNDRV